jgi:carbonic anhydrase
MKIQSILLAGFILGLTQFCWAQDVDQPLSQVEQEAFTPEEVLQALLAGNQRFAADEMTHRDIPSRIAAASAGQYPKAVILSCLDSRVPVEIIFDLSIGDIFVGRVAGNIVNEDQLGSMEFATNLAGAKLVMVLGHSECGAVKGAIDGAEMGNLTALLAKIRPAIDSVEGFSPADRTSLNDDFVNRVIDQNVHEMLVQVRKNSPVLAELEQSGQIKIVGATYDLETGKVNIIE